VFYLCVCVCDVCELKDLLIDCLNYIYICPKRSVALSVNSSEHDCSIGCGLYAFLSNMTESGWNQYRIF